jgi:hypothetical protein
MWLETRCKVFRSLLAGLSVSRPSISSQSVWGESGNAILGNNRCSAFTPVRPFVRSTTIETGGNTPITHFLGAAHGSQLQTPEVLDMSLSTLRCTPLDAFSATLNGCFSSVGSAAAMEQITMAGSACTCFIPENRMQCTIKCRKPQLTCYFAWLPDAVRNEPECAVRCVTPM